LSTAITLPPFLASIPICLFFEKVLCFISIRVPSSTHKTPPRQITVIRNAVATFYRCTFSNGQRGCDNYPDCTGGKGCINPIGCRQIDDLSILGDNGDICFAIKLKFKIVHRNGRNE
jgi:hypothetical protein